jgi:hypothetical protein
MQVIIYAQNGQVAVCTPTGEISIEEVLTKDCPAGAIIIDDSELPKEDFDAWELVDGKVVVNQTKKSTILAKQESETTAKQSALAKLTALGLTQAEVTALLG